MCSTEQKRESCIRVFIWTLIPLCVVSIISCALFLQFCLGCSDPRLKLESLSVGVISNNTRAAEWNVAFSITGCSHKATIPLNACKCDGDYFDEYRVSVVVYSNMAPDQFEKTVTPFNPPRNGREIVSLVNATIYSLLPPAPTINEGLALDFEVGLIASSYVSRRTHKRELHCKNMTVSFPSHATKGNIINKGGGPLFDCSDSGDY